MHFYSIIEELASKCDIEMFVDMDGVIASYDFGKPLRFDIKRPIKTNINTLKKVSEIKNVKLHILSVCRTNPQIEEKTNWLDINAPFFKKENRHILSKQIMLNMTSAEMKTKFLSNFKTNSQIVVIDDDNSVLYFMNSHLKNVILFQDSELVD